MVCKVAESAVLQEILPSWKAVFDSVFELSVTKYSFVPIVTFVPGSTPSPTKTP